MTLVRIRNSLILLIIGLYLVLNSGFMLVRVPPGSASGIPIGELLLLFFIFAFIEEVKWLPNFSRSISLVPFVLWWALGLGRALAAVPEHGMWALRDATHVIESLFLWVGFVFAADPRAIDRFFVWLRRILAIGCIYALTFPFRDALRDFSPTIQAAAGYTATILFNYTNSALVLLMAVAHRVIIRPPNSGIGSLVVTGFLVAYAVAVFQSRTVYLQLIALVVLFAWQRRAAFGRIGLALTVGVFAIFFVTLSDVGFTGRIARPISLDFVGRHFAAIFGVESEGVVGPARGVWQRLDWWSIIWRQVTDSPGNLLFGLGYGSPLIEFVATDNVLVREPHNSYISILGRLGLAGIVLFTWGHILLLRSWFRAFGLCRRVGYREGCERLLVFMVYFVLVWVFSLGGDAFEKPFVAIPYYFFWGIVLHYGQHLRGALTEDGPRAYAPPLRVGDQVHARAPRP